MNARHRFGIVVSAVICSLVASVLICGCNPRSTEEPQAQPPEIEIEEREKPEAERSWEAFVADAKEAVKKDPSAIFGYEAYHEYEGKSFGVMVVGWKDSEYIIDLYHYNPETKKWDSAPTYQPPDGYEAIDTTVASKKWGVPKETLDHWIDQADEAMHEENRPDAGKQ